MKRDQENSWEAQDRRSVPRSSAQQYYSVEFSIRDLAPLYQFRLRDTSSYGLGVLVKEGSDVLKYLKVGDVLELKYYRTKMSEQPEYLGTVIRHVTHCTEGWFTGHYIVGLSLHENETTH